MCTAGKQRLKPVYTKIQRTHENFYNAYNFWMLCKVKELNNELESWLLQRERRISKSHKNNIGLTFSITTVSGNVVLKSC